MPPLALPARAGTMASSNPNINGTGANSSTRIVTNGADGPQQEEEETQMNLDATTWDQIMAKYWASTAANREREDAELREAFAREERELADRQLKLGQERVKLLEQLKAIDQQWTEIEAQRKTKEKDQKRRCETIREERERDDELKRSWFEENRRKAASGEKGQDPAGLAMLAKKAQGVAAVAGGELCNGSGSTSGLSSQRETPLREEAQQRQRHALPSRPREGGRTPSEEHDRAQELQQQLRNEQQQQKERTENGLDGKAVDMDKLPKVYNGAGTCVGHVRPINLRNHLTMHIQQQPIKRHVQTRQGRNFTAETLETIYEPSDKKGAKWLSCWIQATGHVQETPCASCTTRQGVFPQCIILDAEGFPRCGNCEWNRQGCSGASKHADHEMAEASPKAGNGEVAQEAPVVTSGFKAVNGTSASQKTAKVVSNGDEQPARSKLPSGRKSLPSTRKSSVQPESIAPTPLEGSPAPNDSDHAEDLPPINLANLALRDDGTVFTDPPCMRGVPLVRIGPDHPYWDPEWVALEEPIQAQLAKWSEKYEKLKNEGGAASTKYLAGRQQNRGKLVLDFLAKGEFHPYQLMAKHLINKAYIGYDNLYRMVQVLEELKRFKQLDVSPSQWLRHRLHEIHEELGDKFNLGKAVENLYSDPKLRLLRSESGFGNIGRPRGYKPTMADKGEDGPAPKKAAKGTKRKAAAAHSTDDPANQSEEQLRVVDHHQAADTRAPSSHSSPSTSEEMGHPTHAISKPPAAKHHQPSPSVTLKIQAPPEDLYYEGYTSDDSYSGDKITEVDWRLLQVRHREMTTNTGITQYWHWLGAGEDLTGRGEENCFEHQVLKDVKGRRVTWGVYKEPIDFHLRLDEIEEVVYAPEGSGCLKILISVKKDAAHHHHHRHHGDEEEEEEAQEAQESRGDVLAWFKRERTKRRFLSFLVKKGKRVVRSTAAYVEQAWDDMDSVVLPHEDE
ncbi:uncharacterized protein NCU05718 [Neurospora crassa OR74A]|uniref:Uncharacterized protein n=1 Tax=Neurospora crassa (strain ATCC 24698 / 74-OR23-1A / CBS 708.71 / DSM 1257 / FGSC 987) TaxID=367110 RepID=U9W2V6_NEUCR|nr:hypothetical protein NCU05718 [Neurospora crassa OR74A]XP_011393874.1 uncharacterized protein NCU05718 [Neurospora crassa OR74A]ESA43136.1 hypothetical protein NCU05718 [Neurospora crassa OR74A]ESA43137.1 hypothetical protein, variant [Neurospora crassa OR74A]|eukprot:XP_011393873.1 hypothetical protein NCU05718 [Neurospora crassa OR74A]